MQQDQLTSGQAVNDSNDALLKLKSQKENNCQLYKYEISNANKCYGEYNRKYANLMMTVKSSEETRLHYFKEHIGNYIKSLNELNSTSIEMITQMSNRLSSWQIEKDLNKFLNEIQFYSIENGIRIASEVFALFNSKMIDNTSSSIQEGSNQLASLFNKGKEFISGFGDYEFIDVNYYNHDYKTKLVENFILTLLTENEAQSDIMTQLMSLLSENSFPQVFINIHKDKQKSSFLKITNNKNLTHLANLFNTVFLNNLIDKDILNGLILYILFIAQRTYSCFENKHKIFLCGILGRNKIFQTKKFWIDLIEFKLKTNLLSCKSRIEEKYQQIVKQENEQNTSNTGFFGMVGKSLYTIANNTISGSITEMKPNNSINPFAQLAQFPTFYLLPQKLKSEFLAKANGELQKLIYNFIPYYANFSFGTGNAIDFIVELGNKYSLSNEVINYYVICLNSASYSIKQQHTDDVNFFNVHNPYHNKEIKYTRVSIKYNGMSKAKDEDKITLFKEILRFLDAKALINLLLLSKRSSRILSKKIYKDYLNRKDLNIKVRLGIWSVILKTV